MGCLQLQCVGLLNTYVVVGWRGLLVYVIEDVLVLVAGLGPWCH